MPTVSIIIPVYNMEQHLHRCLDSVLQQSFSDFEALCINDGSTDSSLNILNQYAKQDTRIKIITQSNQGLSQARNTGLRAAQGVYISFIDSDDYVDKSFIEDLYRQALLSQADMVMTNIKYWVGKQLIQRQCHQPEAISFADKIKAIPNGSCCNKLYKLSFLQNHHLSFPQGLYWEDNLFTIQACYYSNKLSIINGGSYNYIQNSQSISQHIDKEHKRRTDALIIAERLMHFLEQQHCCQDEQELVATFCWDHFIPHTNLLDRQYYNRLIQIFGPIKIITKAHRKAQKKHLKEQLKKLAHKIFFIKK